jgi:hypothetical protein
MQRDETGIGVADEQEDLFDTLGYTIHRNAVKLPATVIEGDVNANETVFALVELYTSGDGHMRRKECRHEIDAKVLDSLIVPNKLANDLRTRVYTTNGKGSEAPVEPAGEPTKASGNVLQLNPGPKAAGIILGKPETYNNHAALAKLSPEDLAKIAEEIGVDLAGVANKAEAVHHITAALEANAMAVKVDEAPEADDAGGEGE